MSPPDLYEIIRTGLEEVFEELQVNPPNEIRGKYENILQLVDSFLDSEKVDIRSEELIVFLFDNLLQKFRALGVFSRNIVESGRQNF